MFENVKNCGVGKFISHSKWIHPKRIIDSYEIILVTKGKVYINENGTNYLLNENEILILEPGLQHYGYKPSTDTEFFWLHWYDDLDIMSNIKHRKLENPYNVTLYFRQLIEARVSQKTSETMDYLTRLILIELYSYSNQPNAHPVIDKIVAYVRANKNTAITESQIANQLGYNVDYLNRLFKANFSKTIKQYANEERIKYIKTLMLFDNLSLKEIATKAGFEEYKYFLKFFKYHEKITPTDFYKQHAKIHINSQ